eukprot:5048422-Pyramimonas_sp.AAC.1
MFDTPFGWPVYVKKHVVQARDSHVRDPPTLPGCLQTHGSSSGNHGRYAPGWPGNIKTRGLCSGEPC